MKPNEINDNLYEPVLNKIINFIAYASRSHSEVENRLNKYLYKKELSEEDADEIKTRIKHTLEDLKLLDDEQYARSYVEGRIRSGKPLSKRKISEFLFKKGISRELTEEVLKLFTEEIELVAINELIDKKLVTLRVGNSRKNRQKLISYLLNKGFSPHLVYPAVDTKTNLQ